MTTSKAGPGRWRSGSDVGHLALRPRRGKEQGNPEPRPPAVLSARLAWLGATPSASR